MTLYERHCIDHANGLTRGQLKQRLDLEIENSTALSEDFRDLKAQMQSYRVSSEASMEPVALSRIVIAAESCLAESRLGFFRWPSLVGAGAAVSLAIAALVGLNQEQAPVPRVNSPPRVQIAFSRADGAVRLYLTMPSRTHNKETS